MDTQNLKTRIADAIYRQSVYRDKTDNDHTTELMLKILSSEISLAVIELREALTRPLHPAVTKCGCEKGVHTCHNCVRRMGREDALRAFDIKYKELQEKNLLV